MALGQVALCECSCLLNEFGFGDQIRKSCGWKHRDHVDKVKLGMKVLRKVSCHFQGGLGRWAKVDGQQDFRRDGRKSMNFRHDGLLAEPRKVMQVYSLQS
jgi:hypothetical protein